MGDFILDLGLDIDLSKGFDPEEEKWNALVEATLAGNVVPVIGPDIICNYDEGENINEKIITSIAKQFKIDTRHKTFSQLVYDSKFLLGMREFFKNPSLSQDAIYAIVANIFNNQANVAQHFKPSEALKSLLSIKYFPFVITTSFSPVVENLMREVWAGKELKVLSFCNNPQKDTKPGVGDISSAHDMNKPTVYYMFGKSSVQPHSYVLTDTDMLEFCRSWLSDQTRPRNLCSQLKDKYLLMLGCGYSDWLFRFIWFCMNKRSDTKTKGLMASDKSTHETLVEYLKRIDTFLPQNKTPEEIIIEIDKKIKNYNKQNESMFFSRPQLGTDVFISYSRSDSHIAEVLYRYLKEQGLNVWYDRQNLLGGTKFMSEIETAIETTKVFVPIFTNNIAKEAMDAHVYRKEWKVALGLQESMGKRKFIIPTHEENFDFYSPSTDIPKELKSHNSVMFNKDLDFSLLLHSINEALKDLDTFKSNSGR